MQNGALIHREGLNARFETPGPDISIPSFAAPLAQKVLITAPRS